MPHNIKEFFDKGKEEFLCQEKINLTREPISKKQINRKTSNLSLKELQESQEENMRKTAKVLGFVPGVKK